METGVLLKLFIIVLGVCLLILAVLSLAKRRMTEQFCLAWAVLAGLMILAGILLQPSQLDRYVSMRIFILILLMVLGVVWGMWFISTQVSILMRKNQELAMQLSLLNQDSEKVLKELNELKGMLKEKESSLRRSEQ